MRRCAAVLACAALLGAAPAVPQEVRTIRPIEREADTRKAFPRAAPIAAPLAISPQRVEDAMRQVVLAWNRRELGGLLARDFRDRSRLLDALRTRVPRRATLVLVSVQRWEILDQAVVSGALRTRVNVTARTRIDYLDEAGAYRPRDGVNDYVLTLLDTALR